MGARIRAHDWAATPLGPLAAWPAALRIALGMVLASSFPACIVWGPRLVTLYNDAFRPILGAKPEALGRPFNEVWREAWDMIGPIADRAFAGEATYIEDFALTVERGSGPEEVFFTFCYSPIRNEAGRVAGFLNTVIETTGKVLAERRQAYLQHLEQALHGLADPHGITFAAAATLGRWLGARRAGFSEIDAKSRATLIGCDWTEAGVASLGHEARVLDAFGPGNIAELRAGHTLVVTDCLDDPRCVDELHSAGTAPAAAWASIGTRAIIVVPLLGAAGLAAIFCVHEAAPRQWRESEIQLAEDTARRTWAAVERARAEAALQEREERLRLVLESVRDHAIFTTDPEGVIDGWLPGAAIVFGWSAAEAVGQPAAITFTPEDRAAGAPEAEFDTARREGIAPDLRWHLRKDGCRVFIDGSTTALHRPDGGIRGFLKIGQDVTERRRAEEANARLAAIVTSTTDAIVSYAAADGRILSWNQGAEALFGYAEAEALGGPVGLLVPPEKSGEEHSRVYQRVLAGERFHEYPTVRMTKSGERVPVAITASRMLAPDGRVIGVAAIFRDLRQRRQAEERQALLAREVDHRAKNALAVVLAALRLTPRDDVHSYAEAVEGRVGALARAQTLLADEQWNGAGLRALLQGEMAPFLGGQRVDLDGPPVVLPAGTAQPLAMAVHELATNALKYGALSVPEGRVAVSWRLEGGAAGLLRLRWVEIGGPPVDGPPRRRGFGSRVLDGTVRGQLGGTVMLDWARGGLVCELAVPLGRGGASG